MSATEIVSHEEPLSKLERVRLKNSLAQKKYRVRKQEERRQLQQEAAELAVRVAQAEAERSALDAEVRDLQAKLGGEHLEAAAAPSSNGQEEPFYCPAEEGFEGLEPNMLRQGLILQAAFQPPRRYTFEEALRISVKEHCEIRKEFVLKASQLLLANPDRDPDSLEGKQLRALMSECQGVVAWLAVFHPQMLYKLTTVTGDTLQPAPEAPSGLYLSILRKLRLSREQEDYLLALLAQSASRKQALVRERSHLQQALLACLDASGISTGGSGGGGSVSMHARSHAVFASLVRRLRDCVDNFHVEQCKFYIRSSCTCGRALPPHRAKQLLGLDLWQDAQLLALSWPLFPSKSALMQEIARLRGQEPREAEGQGLLQQQQQQEQQLAEPSAAAVEEKPYEPAPLKILGEWVELKLQLSKES